MRRVIQSFLLDCRREQLLHWRTFGFWLSSRFEHPHCIKKVFGERETGRETRRRRGGSRMGKASLLSSLGEVDVSPFHVRADKVDLHSIAHVEAIKTGHKSSLDRQ